MRKSRHDAILEIYQLLLAIFLFTSPWAFAFASGTIGIDAWVSAVLLGAISFAALIAFREWEDWTICLLGLWILASPWILGFEYTTAMHINLAVGILTLYLAALKLWLMHYGSTSERTI
jgi:hypothetical protein